MVIAFENNLWVDIGSASRLCFGKQMLTMDANFKSVSMQFFLLLLLSTYVALSLLLTYTTSTSSQTTLTLTNCHSFKFNYVFIKVDSSQRTFHYRCKYLELQRKLSTFQEGRLGSTVKKSSPTCWNTSSPRPASI